MRATSVAAARDILARITGAAGTDIHDGLLLAQRVFDAYPEAGPHSLVLLSDMVERSARLNVAGVGADDASIASTIDGLAAEGLMPNLRGVQAYVVGAGVSQGGTSMPADRFLAIQRFWQAYLSRAGADLPSERYGAALVRFPRDGDDDFPRTAVLDRARRRLARLAIGADPRTARAPFAHPRFGMDAG